MKYKQFNPLKNNLKEIYHLLIGGVSPRPIAFVGSIDKKNNVNLAPFSFFNAFGANPPIIGFSPTLSGRTGLPKDTLLNIKETKNFTISIVTKKIVNQVSLSSCEYKRDIDEFVKTGLNKFKSIKIDAPGVAESPFIMECKLHRIIELGGKPASGNLILGEIVLFHVNHSILDENNSIISNNINHIGRAGGPWYVDTKNSLFELSKPKGLGIGFDKLPLKLLNSNLSGSQLSKLASVNKIPKIKIHNNDMDLSFEDIEYKLMNLLDDDLIEKAWQFFLNWELKLK